jgi:transposase
MAKAYSLDLRRKAFAAWQEGESSQAEVADRFGVSESFVRDLSALHRQTGSVAARPRGGGRQSLASPAALTHLTGMVAAHNDRTIAEHHQGMLAAGFVMSAATVGRLLLRLQLTRKKRRSKTMRLAARG